MADQVTAFPLRLRDARLRALVREVARREGVSQNAVIERAIQDDMVVRGRLMSEDLQRAAEHLSQLSEEAHAQVLARSRAEFAEAEGRADPIAARALESSLDPLGEDGPLVHPLVLDRLGVLAAFRAAHR